MAKIYPKLEDIQILKVKPTDGEWYLLNWLNEHLDDDIEIYFQPFINGDRPDIVLLQRHAGITIIEVKDWNLDHYYIDENKHWVLEKNRSLIKSPLFQVETYKDNLFGLHIYGLAEQKAFDTRVYGIVNTVVYFHKESGRRINEFMQRDNRKTYTQCLGNDTLMGLRLPTKYNEHRALFQDAIYKKMVRYCQPPFHTIEEGKEIIYSKRQSELTISEPGYKKIRGVAGAGKTLVLAKRAVNAHKRHNQAVLILTFNLALKNYIHDNISDVREQFKWDSFQIINYHQFFIAEANNHNLSFSDLSDFDNENFFESVRNHLEKYETILIDEIQDYKTSWIRMIKEYFLVPNGELIVFGDEKQNIYAIELGDDRKPNTTISGRWNELKESYRLSKSIARIASNFQQYFFQNKYDTESIEIKKRNGVFDFTSIYSEQFLYEFLPTNHDFEDIASKIFQFAQVNNIHPNDITIMGADISALRGIDYFIRLKHYENTITSFESHEIFELLQNDKEKLQEIRRNKKNAMWMNGGTMKIITMHSFKGMETPVGILIINNKKLISEELIYTAITRCRYKLYILNLGNEKYNNFFEHENININQKETSNDILFGTIKKILNDNEKGKDGFISSDGGDYYFNLPIHIGFSKDVSTGSSVKFVEIPQTNGKKRAKIIKVVPL